jgi:outer membrane receptor protein involved in Fe transport
MGGLIKYVTVDPSTDRLAGQVRVGANSSYRGEQGYDVLGAVNVPVSDTFAVRASGSARRDPGYIDDIFSGQDDVNRLDSQTARVVGLWQPDPDLSLKLSALYQHSKRGGSSEVDLPSRVSEVDPAAPPGQCPVPADLQQCSLGNTGWQKQEFQAYSLIVTKNWGSTQLTSLTGYSKKDISNLQDYTPSILGAVIAPNFFGVGGFTINGFDDMTKLSEELRLSMPLTRRIDWMLGLFYTRENRHTPYLFQAVDPYTLAPSSVTAPPDSGLPGGLAYEGDDPQGYKEYAVFTDFTFKLTDRFDVQVGGRASHNRLHYSSASTGLINVALLEPFNRVLPELTSTDDPFTYLLSPRLRISPDLMIYARFASGYRPGGFNITPSIRAQGHPDFTHDTTQSYELGAKGNAFDDRLVFDASIYYIDWKDIQLQLTDPTDVTVKYTLNAGAAISKGAELTLAWHPLQSLTIETWGNYGDATLTEVPSNFSLNAQAGDRLPYSARWTGGVSADQRFAITGNATGFLGATYSYVGDRKGQFLSGGLTQGTFPSYTQIDARGGATWDAWRLDAFVSNVTDVRGVLRNGHDSLMGLDYRATYIRPRTYGLSLTRTF